MQAPGAATVWCRSAAETAKLEKGAAASSSMGTVEDGQASWPSPPGRPSVSARAVTASTSS
nr:hypothetical protein DA06_19990 [Georgenia sp. SUBG003]